MREADHSHPSSAEIKNVGAVALVPHSHKHRENFTFTYLRPFYPTAEMDVHVLNPSADLGELTHESSSIQLLSRVLSFVYVKSSEWLFSESIIIRIMTAINCTIESINQPSASILPSSRCPLHLQRILH
jgi:hypothetical protein